MKVVGLMRRCYWVTNLLAIGSIGGGSDQILATGWDDPGTHRWIPSFLGARCAAEMRPAAQLVTPGPADHAVGDSNSPDTPLTLVFVGERGKGKSTTITNMWNCVRAIGFDDPKEILLPLEHESGAVHASNVAGVNLAAENEVRWRDGTIEATCHPCCEGRPLAHLGGRRFRVNFIDMPGLLPSLLAGSSHDASGTSPPPVMDNQERISRLIDVINQVPRVHAIVWVISGEMPRVSDDVDGVYNLLLTNTPKELPFYIAVTRGRYEENPSHRLKDVLEHSSFRQILAGEEFHQVQLGPYQRYTHPKVVHISRGFLDCLFGMYDEDEERMTRRQYEHTAREIESFFDQISSLPGVEGALFSELVARRKQLYEKAEILREIIDQYHAKQADIEFILGQLRLQRQRMEQNQEFVQTIITDEDDYQPLPEGTKDSFCQSCRGYCHPQCQLPDFIGEVGSNQMRQCEAFYTTRRHTVPEIDAIIAAGPANFRLHPDRRDQNREAAYHSFVRSRGAGWVQTEAQDRCTMPPCGHESQQHYHVRERLVGKKRLLRVNTAMKENYEAATRAIAANEAQTEDMKEEMDRLREIIDQYGVQMRDLHYALGEIAHARYPDRYREYLHQRVTQTERNLEHVAREDDPRGYAELSALRQELRRYDLILGGESPVSVEPLHLGESE